MMMGIHVIGGLQYVRCLLFRYIGLDVPLYWGPSDEQSTSCYSNARAQFHCTFILFLYHNNNGGEAPVLILVCLK